MKASKIDEYFIDIMTDHATRFSNIKTEDVYYYCVWTYYWLTDFSACTHGCSSESVTRNLKGLGDVYESL